MCYIVSHKMTKYGNFHKSLYGYIALRPFSCFKFGDFKRVYSILNKDIHPYS